VTNVLAFSVIKQPQNSRLRQSYVVTHVLNCRMFSRESATYT